MREKLPRFFIEQKALSELDKKHEKYFEEDPSLLEEVRLLEKDNEEILEKYPASEMAALIKARLEKERGGSPEENKPGKIISFVKSPAPLLAAAALAILFVAVPFLRGTNQDGGTALVEGNRTKGLKPAVTVFRESEGKANELKPGDFVKENDLLQIKYNAGEYLYGVLVSIDGRGTVTLHFPASTHSSQTLERGSNARIPYAYELDDAPDYERFYFIFSNKELSVDDVISRAESLADRHKVQNTDKLFNDPDLYQSSILLRKEEVR